MRSDVVTDSFFDDTSLPLGALAKVPMSLKPAWDSNLPTVLWVLPYYKYGAMAAKLE